MSKIGELLGRRRPQFGTGLQYDANLQPVENKDLVYASFRFGLDMSDAPENLDLDRAVAALDMEVTRNNRLIRSPGVRQVSNVNPRKLKWLFEQGSLDYVVELVAFDPPYLGYYDAAGWHWVNVGLANTSVLGWNALTYLGDLLFSNGTTATYTRAASAAIVTDVSAQVIARTFAEQFGRIFAGAPVIAGGTQVLTMQWNDTSGLIGGWGGTGAGVEPLLPANGAVDQILAVRPLGFDLLAILMRNSLWAGYPTGRDDRPADFRFRIGGIGCVAERTARVSPGGVTFLSDEGVVNYDTNKVEIISGPINSEILPLDYTRLDQYVGAYIQRRRRYCLLTPLGLYVYEFPIGELQIPGRWLKRSVTADSMVTFTDQAAVVSWDLLVGTWDQQTLAWDQLGTPNWATPANLYFGLATLFGVDDPTIETIFGTSFDSMWRTPQSLRDAATDRITTLGWEIIYTSQAATTIKLKTPDDNGDFNNECEQVLPATLGQVRKAMIWNTQEGQGAQAQLEITAGMPEILRLRQIVQLDGPSEVALG